MLEFIMLGFLLYGDMSGYDIKQFMESSTAYFYDASYGSIYPTLKRMERNGSVILTETVESGKYKKVYSLTEKGRNDFFRWLEQPIEYRRPRQDYLVKIFFLGFLPEDGARSLLAEFIGRMEAKLSELEILEVKLGEHMKGFEGATLDYGKGYYRFTVDWCRRLLGNMPSGVPNPEQEGECR
jgi:DNA-binding PadR family transcriptional regulator